MPKATNLRLGIVLNLCNVYEIRIHFGTEDNTPQWSYSNAAEETEMVNQMIEKFENAVTEEEASLWGDAINMATQWDRHIPIGTDLQWHQFLSLNSEMWVRWNHVDCVVEYCMIEGHAFCQKTMQDVTYYTDGLGRRCSSSKPVVIREMRMAGE